MSPSFQPESLDLFFTGLRESGFHLGLDPEFSTIRKLALAPPDQRWPLLRENIDPFFWARGFPILEKLQQKAAEQQNGPMVQVLASMHQVIAGFFAGQFVAVAKNQELPQPAMLREMLRLLNTSDSDAVIACIDQNIQLLDGHFFMSLSESLRNLHGRAPGSPQQAEQLQFTGKALLMLGRLVAEARLKAGLPCSFHVLYGI